MIIGYPGMVEQPTERSRDPVQGWAATRTWHGTLSASRAMLAMLEPFDLRVRHFSVSPGIYGVSVEFTDAQDGSAPPADPDDLQVVTWTLDGNDLLKPIFENAAFTALDDADQENLRGLANNEIRQTHTVITSMTGDAGEFRDLILQGVTSYPVSQYVLTRTGTVPLEWNGQYSLTNVGKRFASTASLESLESVPSDLAVALPTGEWLKRTPTFSQERNGRYRIVNEFWHADTWAEVLYDLAT